MDEPFRLTPKQIDELTLVQAMFYFKVKEEEKRLSVNETIERVWEAKRRKEQGSKK